MKLGEGKDRRGENGVKLELRGRLGSSSARPGLRLNGKAASAPQWARRRAWAAAWRGARAVELKAVQGMWRKNLLWMTSEELGLNGKGFLKDGLGLQIMDLDSKLGVGEVCVAKSASRLGCPRPGSQPRVARAGNLGLTAAAATTTHRTGWC
jgi:hypothetical protein